ncbi:MAG TPA: gamma-glutamyltransferase family protein [Vicinamibacterales bacterium]|nr:gamma-glutamyltransferase family protein [Vicinamibacterales bacterium]
MVATVAFLAVGNGILHAQLRPEFRGRRAVVAAGRSYTAEAGARLIAQGGNAIDAGVAAIFAAAVVEISHFGLGGEAPIIIYSARDRQVVVLNGQGSAPRAANPSMFAGQRAIPGNGPLGATIPAVVDAATIALARYGTRSLAETLAPALALADGFPNYEFLRRYLESERRACEPYAWTMKTYYPDGRVTPTGEMFRQPNLAKTLRALAEAERAAAAAGATREQAIRAGRDAFYKGDIARRIAAAVREAGGVISEEDLAAYEGRIEQPVSATYRGLTVYKAGPWNQGPVLLQTLRLLEGFDLRRMGAGSADAIHVATEAIKLAYADRDRYYGDPDFVTVPMNDLLSDAYTARRRGLIDPARASLEVRPGAQVSTTEPDHEPGDTTAIEVADKDGNLFSATPSSGWLLGGAFVAGDTGVPMSNRMQAFRLDPSSPNVLAGGKRPRTTLTPTVILKDGAPFLAIGTPGGDSQDQQILNVLLNLVDFGMDVQAAIEAPRFNSLHPESSFDDHRSQPGVLEVEATVPAAARDELARRGHVLRVRAPYGISTGVVAAGIDPATGLLRGGADPRRERYIVAW